MIMAIWEYRGRWTAQISDSEADADHILTTRMVLYINDFGNESGQ